MPISADTLRLQFDYSSWATQRLVDIAGRLSLDELTRDFQTSDRCVLDTLVHIYAADRFWLSRALREPPASSSDPGARDLTVLQTQWPALHQQWKLWMRDFTDRSVAETNIAFEDMRGKPHAKPVWQIVLHVVNHGTHHRGQVSGFLRAMGHTPPPLDLMEYYMKL
jgi:uncharacterized damage-inducible protein DinB